MVKYEWEDILKKAYKKNIDKNNLSCEKKQKFNLKNLIDIIGFDITEENWVINSNLVLEKYVKRKVKNVLELGSGSGAWLMPFYKKGIIVSGIEQNSDLVNYSKIALPKGTFYQKKAQEKIHELNNKFDLILCNSVFQYLSNYEELEKVIKNIAYYMKEEGVCCLTDLFLDVEKKNYDEFRIKELKISKKSYNKKYNQSIKHLYLNNEKVNNILKNNKLSGEWYKNVFVGYPHGKFRYDLIIKKVQK